MGGIVRGLFGGSKNKNESGNKAFDTLSTTLTPALQTGVNTLGNISAFFGGQGADAQNAAFQNFLDSTGFQHMLDTGSKAITGNASARGLLKSGATAKALTNYGQELGKASFLNFLQPQLQLAQLGLGAGNTIAGAGQYSKGSGTSNNGIIPGLFG